MEPKTTKDGQTVLGTCPVCAGNIVGHAQTAYTYPSTYYVYGGSGNSRHYSPLPAGSSTYTTDGSVTGTSLSGALNMQTYYDEYHCNDCGVKFAKLPNLTSEMI